MNLNEELQQTESKTSAELQQELKQLDKEQQEAYAAQRRREQHIRLLHLVIEQKEEEDAAVTGSVEVVGTIRVEGDS